MFESAYIEDGYTRKGYIIGERNIYPNVRFEYRPMLYADRRTIMASYDNPNQKNIAAKATAKRIEKWDIKKPDRDEGGKIVGEKLVEITESEILKLTPDLVDTMFFIIAGRTPSDTDPDWSQEETQENDEDQLAAAIEGTDPGISREEADSKNSAAG